MHCPRKSTLLISCLFVFSVLGYNLISPRNICAQTPLPAIVSCNEVINPEFNSLRPYRARPCVTYDTNTATFCGNDLTIKDTVEVQYPGDQTDSCTTTGNKIYCDYTVEVNKPIGINLNGAELPIMGNTEDVTNSTNAADNLSDQEKMNSYASWYLNGVINQAEYGSSKSDDYSTVNLSGPLQKLLPDAILNAQRIKTIENARETNHNQIVACATRGGPIRNLLNVGYVKPIECYKGGGAETQGEIFRLKAESIDRNAYGWDDKISWARSIANAFPDGIKFVLESLLKLFPESMVTEMIQGNIDTSLSSAWNKATPPLPWDDGTADPGEPAKPFASELLYRKAYYEWHGKTCVIVPLVKHLVCVENLIIPNMYSDLFPYVPLSTTEDVEGEIKMDNQSLTLIPSSNGTVVKDITFESSSTSKIYLSHMGEVDQLGGLLQSTFVATSEGKLGDPTQVAKSSACSSVEVRSNPGDDLFASQIRGNLGYTAQFTCEYEASPATSTSNACYAVGGRCAPTGWICANTFGQQDCPTGTTCGNNCVSQIQKCTKDIYIGMSTQTKIPLVDNIWSRLVAGPMSIFKRIFPKTNTEGSVGQIMDIPGSINVTYSGTNIDVSSANTDLKLPHLGGISEYFLKGIQTALRPKGYGDPIAFANSSSLPEIGLPTECSNEEVPPGTCDGSVFSKYNPPPKTTASGKNYFETYIFPYLSSDLLAVYKEAERRTGVPCEVLAGIHFREGSNNPNQSLQNGGPIQGCLLESAETAGWQLAGAVGGTIDSWNELITALMRYNGPGNSNCSDTNSIYSGPCPPPEGIDHNYTVNWIDYSHLKMNIIYCWDYTKCPLPYPIDGRPGALTVATELYNH